MIKRVTALLAAVLLLPALAACTSGTSGGSVSEPTPGQTIGAQPTGGPPLAGTSWVLVDGPLPATDLAASGITLQFTDTEVSGNSGVNSYAGGYTSSTDGSLQIGALAVTAMAGDEAAMALEGAYLDALQSIFGYTVDGQTLTLVGAADQVLTFTAAQ